MRILESFIRGKVSAATCEDLLYISDDYIAVIDGVTSKCDFCYEGRTTGQIATHMVKQALQDLPVDADVHLFINLVNKRFERFYDVAQFPYDRTQFGPQAVCVVYSVHQHEIWMIGDCQARVGDDIYENPKKSDMVLADYRALMIQTLLDKGMSEAAISANDPARAAILPWILKATRYANDDATEYGYSIINGNQIPDRLIHRIALTPDQHEIILASDGYPVVERTLEESEAELERILSEDPLCCRELHATKGIASGQLSYDDRTYIRFLV